MNSRLPRSLARSLTHFIPYGGTEGLQRQGLMVVFPNLVRPSDYLLKKASYFLRMSIKKPFKGEELRSFAIYNVYAISRI